MKKILPAAALFLLVLPFLSFAEDSEGHDDEPPVIGTYDYKANGGGPIFKNRDYAELSAEFRKANADRRRC